MYPLTQREDRSEEDHLGYHSIKKYKEHGTIGRLAGSGRQPKLTAEVLAFVEAKM